LIDLQRLGIYVKEFVYRIEHCVLKTLEGLDVTGHRVPGAHRASMCAWPIPSAMRRSRSRCPAPSRSRRPRPRASRSRWCRWSGPRCSGSRSGSASRPAAPSTRFYEIKQILREHKLHTVCEEASCPNIGECFGKGTATFMIMGDKCTRRCPFCDVGHGRPDPLDADEPLNLARTIAALKLQYVVITSVDRDDLRDGGAGTSSTASAQTRELSPATRIEVLVPDFRGRDDRALDILREGPARRDEPQPGDRAAPVQGGEPGRTTPSA
jgi:hypothetical protein